MKQGDTRPAGLESVCPPSFQQLRNLEQHLYSGHSVFFEVLADPVLVTHSIGFARTALSRPETHNADQWTQADVNRRKGDYATKWKLLVMRPASAANRRQNS